MCMQLTGHAAVRSRLLLCQASLQRVEGKHAVLCVIKDTLVLVRKVHLLYKASTAQMAEISQSGQISAEVSC